MQTPPWDTLIIGQGLAGSLLAWLLIQQKQHVLILADLTQQSASHMAAGLINPVTGKRLVKSEHYEAHIDQALNLYQALQQFFGITFYHSLDMLRVFQSQDTIQAWDKRCRDTAYSPYLGEQIKQTQYPEIHMPLGGFKQKHTGYLDTALLLDTLGRYFEQHNIIQHRHVNYSDITCDRKYVTVDDIQARQIIFCEGHHATQNPWFNWLPFKPAKGEILTLEIEACQIRDIVNAGHWLLPLQNGLYRFGASYQWDPLDELPDTTTKQNLLNSVKQLLKQHKQIRVQQHDAGIRPASSDSQPFVGLHPQLPNMGIFNGFGSKGSLLIPYYAQLFSKQLNGQVQDLAQADIKRYWQH